MWLTIYNSNVWITVVCLHQIADWDGKVISCIRYYTKKFLENITRINDKIYNRIELFIGRLKCCCHISKICDILIVVKRGLFDKYQLDLSLCFSWIHIFISFSNWFINNQQSISSASKKRSRYFDMQCTIFLNYYGLIFFKYSKIIPY
jgi:hypothetical protein